MKNVILNTTFIFFYLFNKCSKNISCCYFIKFDLLVGHYKKKKVTIIAGWWFVTLFKSEMLGDTPGQGFHWKLWKGKHWERPIFLVINIGICTKVSSTNNSKHNLISLMGSPFLYSFWKRESSWECWVGIDDIGPQLLIHPNILMSQWEVCSSF